MAIAVRIYEDTVGRRPPQWCWRPEWINGYDSSFGLLMKFALLNALTAADMATAFVSRTCGRRTALLRTVDIDLRDHELFDLRALATAMRTDITLVANAFLSSSFLASALPQLISSGASNVLHGDCICRFAKLKP